MNVSVLVKSNSKQDGTEPGTVIVRALDDEEEA